MSGDKDSILVSLDQEMTERKTEDNNIHVKISNESVKRAENDAICRIKIAEESTKRAEENLKLSIRISDSEVKESAENSKLHLKIFELEDKINKLSFGIKEEKEEMKEEVEEVTEEKEEEFDEEMPEIPGIPTFDSTAGDSSDETKLPKDWTVILNKDLHHIRYIYKKQEKIVGIDVIRSLGLLNYKKLDKKKCNLIKHVTKNEFRVRIRGRIFPEDFTNPLDALKKMADLC